MPLPAEWITPVWPAPPGVRAVCTTRAGGRSSGAYASLNLGDHVGDEPALVLANRAIFSGAIEAGAIFMKQVHGCDVAQLAAHTPQGMQADGCVATEPGVACTIMVADCLPVLFASADGHAVAAAHAGWRGLVGDGRQGILDATWTQFQAACARSLQPSDAMAWLGPCIGPGAFEVGPDVKAAFEMHDPLAGALFKPHGDAKWLADLPGLARRRLRALGLTQIFGNDGSREWCTHSNPSRFFSHRRDRISGRFAAAIWRL